MALLHFTPDDFLGHDDLKPRGSPSFGEKAEIQRAKPSLTFLEWPQGHRKEGGVYVDSMCVCLCELPLCSSDNATTPAEARGL